MEIVYMQIAMVLSLIVECLHGSLSIALQGKWFVFVRIRLNFVRSRYRFAKRHIPGEVGDAVSAIAAAEWVHCMKLNLLPFSFSVPTDPLIILISAAVLKLGVAGIVTRGN